MPTPIVEPPAIVGGVRASKRCSDRMAVVATPRDSPAGPKLPHRVHLELFNLGPEACTAFVSPTLAFEDGAGKPLPIRAATGFGWHHGGVDLGHGPVQASIDIAPGASASFDVAWNGATAGPVCFATHSVSVGIPRADDGVDPLAFRWDATICGAHADDVRIEQTPLKPD